MCRTPSHAQNSPSNKLSGTKPNVRMRYRVDGQPAPTDTRIAPADEIEADLSRARLHRDLLRQRLALIDEDPSAHDLVAEQLERVRAALASQINRAVEQARTSPPAYILDLIGDRPAGDAGRTWDQSVQRLEMFRHHHGLNPSSAAGAPGTEPAERALGPRPPTSAAALAWDLTLDAVTQTPRSLEPIL